jgi:hypothetical protein
MAPFLPRVGLPRYHQKIESKYICLQTYVLDFQAPCVIEIVDGFNTFHCLSGVTHPA